MRTHPIEGSADALPAPPPSRALLLEQIRVVAERHGAVLAIVTAILALIALTADISIEVEPKRWLFRSAKPSAALPLLLVLAFVWPLRLWRRRGPAWHYYRSLPIDHRRHDRLRIAAGGALLLSAVAVVCLLALVTSAPQPDARGGIALWASMLSTPLISYLFGSAIALRVREPLLGALAAIGTLFVFAFLLVPGGGLFRVLTWPLTGRLGVANALWQPFVHASGIDPALSSPPGLVWISSVALWLGIAAALAWAAAGAETQR